MKVDIIFKYLFGGGLWTQTPLSRVGVALHDDPLDLGDDAVIAGGHRAGRHHSDGQADGFTLRRHDDDLLVHLDAVLVPQNSGQHDFGAVADRVDGRIFHHDFLVTSQECFERLDDPSQVGLVLVVVVQPLGVQDVVHGDESFVFVLNAGTVSAKLLHLTADPEEKTEMDAEGSDVSSGFAADPEDSHVPLFVVLNLELLHFMVFSLKLV